MLERVGKLFAGRGSRADGVHFHSLGMQLLRQEARELGYKPQFSILTPPTPARLFSDIVASTDKQEIRRVQNAISRWKTR